jgi:phenylacetate-CoA ligase
LKRNDIDRKTMERGFGVKVRNEYGAAELDILAFEDEDGDFVLNEESLFIEILDDNNQPVEAGIEVSGAFSSNGMSFGLTSLNDPDLGTAHAASNTHSAPTWSGRRRCVMLGPRSLEM